MEIWVWRVGFGLSGVFKFGFMEQTGVWPLSRFRFAFMEQIGAGEWGLASEQYLDLTLWSRVGFGL